MLELRATELIEAVDTPCHCCPMSSKTTNPISPGKYDVLTYLQYIVGTKIRKKDKDKKKGADKKKSINEDSVAANKKSAAAEAWNELFTVVVG